MAGLWPCWPGVWHLDGFSVTLGLVMDLMDLPSRVKTLLEPNDPWISNASNFVALVHDALPQASWTGVYLAWDGALTLGPFQGPTACVRIAFDRGVCGAAFSRGETLVVPDVHAFPGHIACDPSSQSEVVLPLRATDGRTVGVLDVDSRSPAAFSENDAVVLADAIDAAAARFDWGDRSWR